MSLGSLVFSWYEINLSQLRWYIKGREQRVVFGFVIPNETHMYISRRHLFSCVGPKMDKFDAPGPRSYPRGPINNVYFFYIPFHKVM